MKKVFLNITKVVAPETIIFSLAAGAALATVEVIAEKNDMPKLKMAAQLAGFLV